MAYHIIKYKLWTNRTFQIRYIITFCPETYWYNYFFSTLNIFETSLMLGSGSLNSPNLETSIIPLGRHLKIWFKRHMKSLHLPSKMRPKPTFSMHKLPISLIVPWFPTVHWPVSWPCPVSSQSLTPATPWLCPAQCFTSRS